VNGPGQLEGRRHGWVPNLLLLGASLVVILVLAEAALRLAGRTYTEFHQPDPTLGYSFRPSAEGWYDGESRVYVRINRHGWRDRERTLARPPDGYRVAVLGDSFSAALQVPLEDAFPSVLERELAGCEALAGRPVEVLNFGVDGYSTAQQLVVLRERAWPWDPDSVVLLFTPDNDLRDNSPSLAGGTVRPFFKLVDGTLVLDDSFRYTTYFQRRTRPLGRAYYYVRNHLAVLRLVMRSRHLLSRPAPAARSVLTDRPDAPELYDIVFQPPPDATWEEAWRVTEALVKAVHSEVAGRGRRFLFVVGTPAPQVHPDAALRREVLAGVGDPDYLRRRLAALAAENGFDAIDLTDPQRAWAETHWRCIHGFEGRRPCNGHWNDLGHRLAGELMAAELCRQIAEP